MPVHPDRLKPGFSLYCDVLRFGAAAAVLITHVAVQKLSGGFLWQLQDFGLPAVMVFFVLSGYIIAYVSSTREAELVEFSAARLARLYSVVVPAIALTFLLEAIGKAHNPAIYDPHHETMPLWRGLSALLFLSQSWGQDLVLLCNSAYWSLPYEFWYYVLFGAALFLRGKTRIIVILVAAAIASPGILLRFPVWLAGVAAYQASRKAPAGKYAPLLFALSLVIVAIGFWLRKTGITPVSDGRFLPYYFSLSDYVIGAGIALNLYAAAGFEMALLQRFKGFIRRTAGMTFSLYLFHQPIFYCVAAYLPAQMSSPVREAIMLTTALIACAVLSHYTEEKKGVLKNAFVVLFRGIQTRRSPVRAA